jgi:hypothetical protein
MALRNQGGRLVIAGPESAASGAGFLATARGLRELARVVSTVDSADTAQGRIALVLALRAAMNGDSHPYGSGPGAVSPLPSISASPAGALTSSGHR